VGPLAGSQGRQTFLARQRLRFVLQDLLDLTETNQF
jgi:hypothetical protein